MLAKLLDRWRVEPRGPRTHPHCAGCGERIRFGEVLLQSGHYRYGRFHRRCLQSFMSGNTHRHASHPQGHRELLELWKAQR